jgi:hypothetical protein
VYLKFSGYLKSLTQLLKVPTKDVIIAYENVNVVIDELESIRKNSDETFLVIWSEAQKIAEQTCSELKRPQSCSRQQVGVTWTPNLRKLSDPYSFT